MAYIGLKQLDPILTGSLQVSGSTGVTGSLLVTGDVTATHITASGNISASGDIFVDDIIADDHIEARRFSSTGDTQFGNSTDDTHTFTGHITASGDISGSSTSTGSFGYLNVAGNSNFIGDLTLGGNITIGDATSDSVTIAADLTSNLIPDANVTYDIGSSTKKWRDGFMASLVVSSSTSQSTAITANNITNGYPTSNAWGDSLDGSYFNNFDNTTHVSEILRFIAGAMSHSLDVSDAAPNTKYWNTLSTTHTEGSTTS